MIAIGIAPGLKNLAYCVLVFDQAGRGTCLDCDVLRGTKASEDVTFEVLIRKARAHQLILQTVFERAEPLRGAVLGIGPPLAMKELPRNIEAVRQMLQALATLFELPVYTYPDRRELYARFGGAKGYDSHLRDPLPTSNGPIVLAATGAVAARLDSVSRGAQSAAG